MCVESHLVGSNITGRRRRELATLRLLPPFPVTRLQPTTMTDSQNVTSSRQPLLRRPNGRHSLESLPLTAHSIHTLPVPYVHVNNGTGRCSVFTKPGTFRDGLLQGDIKAHCVPLAHSPMLIVSSVVYSSSKYGNKLPDWLILLTLGI